MDPEVSPESEVFENYTDAELSDADACPAGVSQDDWNEFLAEADVYKAGWKADLAKHIRQYDRDHPESAAV